MKYKIKALSCFLVSCISFLAIAYQLYERLKNLQPPILDCIPICDTSYTYDTSAYPPIQKLEWAKPCAQSENGLWVYGLFHPPCFAYDSSKSLFGAYPISFRPLQAKDFHLKLLGFEQNHYPVLFEGYYETTVASEYIFLLYDRERKEVLKLSLSGCEQKGVSVLAFRHKIWDERSQAFSEAVLSIFDKRYGKTFDLKLQTIVSLDTFGIALGLEDGRVLNVSTVGETFVVEDNTFCVRSIDAEHKTILLEHKHVKSLDVDYFYLSLCNL